MLEAERMKKVTLIGAKTDMKKVIEKLYSLGNFEITEYSKNPEDATFDIGEPFEEDELYSELYVKLQAVKASLRIPDSIVLEKISEKDGITKVRQELEEIYAQVKIYENKQDHYLKVLKLLTPKKEELALKKIMDFVPFRNDKTNHVHYIGFVQRNNEHPIEDEFQKIMPTSDYMIDSFEGLTLVAVSIKESDQIKMNKLLDDYDFVELDQKISKATLKNTKFSPAKKYQNIKTISISLKSKITEIRRELKKLGTKNSQFLAAADEYLRENIDQFEAPLKFATSDHTFVIRGWAPAKEIVNIKKSLIAITKGRIFFEESKIEKKDRIPIKLNNPKHVQPFEFFMNLYTLPSYKEIDPTAMMFLTFPLFFGFMLGDIGYGFVTLALFTMLKKKMPKAKSILNAFIVASLSTIFFGFLFGELFGLEEFAINNVQYYLPHVLSRSHQIQDLLSIAVMIGVVHILIGLIVGFINVKNAHGLKMAILEKAGWMMILPLIIWLLTNFLGVITGSIAELLGYIMPPLPVAIGLFVIGAVLTIIGEGVIGLIDVLFLSIMSNILSYARLMAVGLASVSLAVVVNDLAGQMFSSGPIGVIGGILILVIGHTINIALGILSPFLHSLRLHYVEFFSKFYKGGGKKFIAFGAKE
ncbi:MAG: V-type ATP synthase subunit I [Nanoarchaeota archaeon]|nr:V-type ATP synthase subunit I [Nanoarchaeota archaeon]